MKSSNLKTLTTAGIIGALYAVLTLLFAPWAIGPFEFRVSEALTILPLFSPAAVPGLTVGCLAANLLCGGNVFDLVFGTCATLLGALGTYFFRKKPVLAFLSPIVANTLIIPPILYFAYGFTEGGFLFLFFAFLVGEALSVGVFGFLLRKLLLPIKHIFS